VGKKVSKRPKSVQTRPSVQNEVLQRIAELRNSGMGYRKISKQLKKEGLATISKGSVANYWKQAQTDKNIAAKALCSNDPELKTLAEIEAKLQKKVNHAQTLEQAQQRIRNLHVQRAETQEGLHDIFSNKEELKEFALQTLQGSKDLKDFERHCAAESSPLEEALAKAVGSLEEYEREKEDLGGELDLPSHIEERMDSFLLDENKRKREENQRETQEQLQKRAPDIMLNFKCSSCGAAYETMSVASPEGVIQCNCGKLYKVSCPECKSRFDFDVEKKVFFCRKCNVSFGRPTLTYHDFTFMKDPPDFSAHDSRKDTPF
jgi:hypothetical protein